MAHRSTHLIAALSLIAVGACGEASDVSRPPADASALDSGHSAAQTKDGGPVSDDEGTDAAVDVVSPEMATADEVKGWVAAYKAKHSGNGGKDWDIVACCKGASTNPKGLALDPEAVRLRSICGPGQLPVIPLLAWEYGGADHPWTAPEASALVYCVYVPVSPSSQHWTYDDASDHVTADVYVKFEDDNPCKDKTGADQLLSCLGDSTNIEILVDTASYLDGTDAGLSLAEASTDLDLDMPDGTKVPLYTDH